jgi:hypothetical protein
MRQGLGEREFTEEQREKIKLQAASYAKRYAIRLTRRKHLPLIDENGSLESGLAALLVSKEPDPLALILEAEQLERFLLPLPEMTLFQQQLFVRHIQQGMRLVDLQEETGRNAHALRTALYTLRKRFIKLLEGKQMDTREIAEYRSMLARLRT